QGLRFPSRRRDVWEHIERAFGHAAGESLDAIQPGDEHIAASLKLLTHMIDRALIAAQGFHSSNLREARSAGIRVGHQPRNLRCKIGPHYPVSHAPAGHGVSLRKTVEQNGPFLEPRLSHDRMVTAIEDQAAVDLV